MSEQRKEPHETDVVTLSILFVCRVPSKWYLKRRETGRTSAWKGYSPLFSWRVSPCSTPMSCPLQVVSDVIHVPIHHSHILQLQYVHKGIFERTFVTRRNSCIVHAHRPTKLFRCRCQSPDHQRQLRRRGWMKFGLREKSGLDICPSMVTNPLKESDDIQLLLSTSTSNVWASTHHPFDELLKVLKYGYRGDRDWSYGFSLWYSGFTEYIYENLCRVVPCNIHEPELQSMLDNLDIILNTLQLLQASVQSFHVF